MSTIMIGGVNFLLVTSIILGHAIFQIRVAAADENPSIICRAASSGCGRCLSAHKDCTWCLDPNFEDEFRCGTSESLKETCRSGSLVSQPENEIQIVTSQELGEINPHSKGPTQLQPNEVKITIRPGVSLTFGLKYRHMDAGSNEVYLLNSDLGQGIKMDVTTSCLEARRLERDPRSCDGVSVGDVISYNLTFTLLDCDLAESDVSVSIGLGGVREILAVYVTPTCGCECEKIGKQELRSEKCHRSGNLICGKCVCHARKSGKFCELESSMATTKAPVDNQCRIKPNEPDCSGRGSCIYGKCICNQMGSSRFYGRYCECDDDSCPKRNNMLCGGHGRCQCGICSCFSGWSGEECGCSDSQEACLSRNGRMCNDAGDCICGICRCHATGEGTVLSPTCEPWLGYAPTTTQKPEPSPQEPSETESARATFPPSPYEHGPPQQTTRLMATKSEPEGAGTASPDDGMRHPVQPAVLHPEHGTPETSSHKETTHGEHASMAGKTPQAVQKQSDTSASRLNCYCCWLNVFLLFGVAMLTTLKVLI